MNALIILALLVLGTAALLIIAVAILSPPDAFDEMLEREKRRALLVGVRRHG